LLWVNDPPLSRQQTRLIDVWWWLSVPYTIVEVLTMRIVGPQIVLSWDVQHWIASLLITTTALAASLSSFVWFVTIMYKAWFGTTTFNAWRVAMLVLSGIAALPSVFFLVVVGVAGTRR